jgi:hypothetical protein
LQDFDLLCVPLASLEVVRFRPFTSTLFFLIVPLHISCLARCSRPWCGS